MVSEHVKITDSLGWGFRPYFTMIQTQAVDNTSQFVGLKPGKEILEGVLGQIQTPISVAENEVMYWAG